MQSKCFCSELILGIQEQKGYLILWMGLCNAYLWNQNILGKRNTPSNRNKKNVLFAIMRISFENCKCILTLIFFSHFCVTAVSNSVLNCRKNVLIIFLLSKPSNNTRLQIATSILVISLITRTRKHYGLVSWERERERERARKQERKGDTKNLNLKAYWWL